MGLLSVDQRVPRLAVEPIGTPVGAPGNLHSTAALDSAAATATATAGSASTKLVFALRTETADRASPLFPAHDVPKAQRRAVRAIAEYDPQRPDEVQVSLGDRLVVVRIFRDDWALGRNETSGAFGVFPKACYDAELLAAGGDASALGASGLLGPGVHTVGRSSITRTPVRMGGKGSPASVAAAECEPAKGEPRAAAAGVVRRVDRHARPGLRLARRARPLTAREQVLVVVCTIAALVAVVAVGLLVPSKPLQPK
ncbi:hypothetical protein HK105_207172 [Polyrhizophydium stewartii]|uniref:SH3 domain-containing protein n=1 Tax=Polyrhizophydium stewartii TaxID=2732419 RepID=A0ABR4N1D5_9FUNG